MTREEIINKIINIGNQLEIPVGNKVFKATAVKEEDDRMLFVFDDIVGKSAMTNIQSFLDYFYQKLPENLRARMGSNTLRLLDESEVFYKNVPDEWEWLTENTQVQVENPPISYFERRDFRACKSFWWLRSVTSPSYFAGVSNSGIANYGSASLDFGVRPAFTIFTGGSYEVN